MKKDSILELHELSIRKENDEEILIGRKDTGDFIILPAIAEDVITIMRTEKTIENTSLMIEDRLGIDIDVDNFVQEVLLEYEFIYKVDERIISEKVVKKEIFPFLTKKVSKFFFNRYSLGLYLATCLIGVLCWIINIDLFPVYHHLFFSESYTTSLIGTILASWTFLLLHELAHLMAARSAGVDSRFAISHRLVFLVVETDMSNIVLLDKLYRYKALLAGLALDGFFLGLGTIVIGLNSWLTLSISTSVISIIQMLNLVLVLRIAFQFMFFMKTDIYYVLTTIFNCRNLLHNTRLYVFHFLRKRNPQLQAEWETVDDYEKKVVKRYALFFLVGSIIAISTFIVYTLPQTVTIISGTFENITYHHITSVQFWDGLLLLILATIPLVLLCYSWFREVRVRRANRFRGA